MTYGVVFAANRLCAFTATPNCYENLGGSYDGAYTDRCLSWNASSTVSDNMFGQFLDYTTGGVATLNGQFGVHYEQWLNAIQAWQQNGTTLWQLENAAGTPVLKAIVLNWNQAAPSAKVQYWNGSSWVDTGISWQHSIGARYTMDFIGSLGAGGSIQAFMNSSSIGSGSIASASATGATGIRFYCPTINNSNASQGAISQILVKDGSTLNRKVGRRTPTGLGNYQSQFVGQTIASLTDNNDGTYMTDNTAGDKASVTMMALTTAPTSFQQIESVVLSGRMNKDTSGVQNAQFFLREGGADYMAPAPVAALGLGFDGRALPFNKDPATGANWSIAAANSVTLEAGIAAEA